MKNLKKLYACILSTVMAVAMVGCSADSTDDHGGTTAKMVDVTLNLSAASNNTATRAWDDSNASDGEMMKNWIVVITTTEGASGKVFQVSESGTLSAEVEKDAVENVKLESGKTYTFYSFANISKDVVANAFGLSGASSLTANATFTPSTIDNATFETKAKDFTIDDAKKSGIPMTSKTKATITDNTRDLTLLLVRLYAKITIDFTNTYDDEITIKSFSILDEITTNKTAVGLFPTTTTAFNGVNDDQKSIDISLPSDIAKHRASYETTLNQKVASNATYSYTFYVNESESTNDFGSFILSVTSDKGGEYTGHALLNQETTGGETDITKMKAVKKIVRNDYLKIPVTIDDYKLVVDIQDYPPIGVYPASVMEEDGVFTCTFHWASHFNIIPTIRKQSNGDDYPNKITSITLTDETGHQADLLQDGLKQLTDPATGQITLYGVFKEGTTTTSNIYQLNIVAKISDNDIRNWKYKLKIVKEFK